MESIALAAFDRTAAELERLLVGDAAPFPELAAARRDLAALVAAPRTRAVLAQSEPLVASLDDIPQTTYTRRRAFARTGDREPYQTPYFLKREKLHAAALRLILGHEEFADAVQDYLWSICEESSWVIPAHTRTIDLMAAETAFGLAEILALAGPAIDAEVRRRVRAEIDNRIFVPFLHASYDLRWFGGGDNWNGVCSGAIGGALLYLEREPGRLAEGLALVLASLKAFLATAFEEDGSSTEGVGYWHYGLQDVVMFAELLRARTGGAIDLLASPRVRQTAAFPGKLLLPGGRYVSFADSAEEVPFAPGIIARLALRAGEPTLLNALAEPATLAPPYGVSMALRDLLWWDGDRREAAPIEDATLLASGIARLTGKMPDGSPLVVVVKAGHNAENHNHNDIGSFIVRVGDETFLVDPGPGHYDRDYFNERRYENIFANSYGHSVPRVGGQLQGNGKSFGGTMLALEGDGGDGPKGAVIEFTRAYPVPTLVSARRGLTLTATGGERGSVWLKDVFRFTDEGEEVEEALVTWLPVEVAGATATIQGRRHRLQLTIEQPDNVQFTVERLEQESRANHKPAVLNRLRFVLPPTPLIEVSVRMVVEPVEAE
ncbi:MAG: heparinase II/III family protein [Chloroflexia bacterium]